MRISDWSSDVCSSDLEVPMKKFMLTAITAGLMASGISMAQADTGVLNADSGDRAARQEARQDNAKARQEMRQDKRDARREVTKENTKDTKEVMKIGRAHV